MRVRTGADVAVTNVVCVALAAVRVVAVDVGLLLIPESVGVGSGVWL
jgi:hypothetical protein